MKEILREVIRQLEDYVHSRPPHHADRAQAVAASLAEALKGGDLPRCKMILASQIHLFNPALETGLESVRGDFYPPAHSGPALAPVGPLRNARNYYPIIKKGFDRIYHLPCTDYVEPGVAICHRIWLGRPLPDERFRTLQATHRHLEGIWRHPRTGRPVSLTTRIWTDSPQLLARTPSIPGVELHDIRPFIETLPPQMAAHAMGFIRHGELAFAADILRYGILERFGGMHLGIHWEAASRRRRTDPAPLFLPSDQAVSTYTVNSAPDFHFECFPFTLNAKGIPFPEPYRIPLSTMLDSDVLYVGSAGSDFMKTVTFYQQHVLSGMRQAGITDVVQKNRQAKTDILERMNRGDPDIRDYTEKRLQQDPEANIGAMLDTYPLILAFEDKECFEARGFGSCACFRLVRKCWLSVELHQDREVWYYHIRQLGLVRNPSRSWLKISPTLRQTVEW